jgi:hypothetical protein
MVMRSVPPSLTQLMKRRLYRLLILLTLIGSAYTGWKYRAPLLHFYHDHIAFTPKPTPKAAPNPQRYQALIADLSAKQKDLGSRYARARTAQEFSSVISESRRTLEEVLPKMMHCWLGTPWDFHGTSETPGVGKIACGYFISTILRDAGFRVERFRLAQQASQNIIATFLPSEEMLITTGESYPDFLDQTISRGPGIHIVGLDNHVAFLVIPASGGPRFIHSSGGAPKCVVDESRENAQALQDSSYRVIGNLTQNDEVIHRWLIGQPWPTKL